MPIKEVEPIEEIPPVVPEKDESATEFKIIKIMSGTPDNPETVLIQPYMSFWPLKLQEDEYTT